MNNRKNNLKIIEAISQSWYIFFRIIETVFCNNKQGGLS